MAYGSDRLPSRFPVGTKFVIEGKRGREGQVQVFSRYLEFPDGTFFPLPVRPAKRKSRARGTTRPAVTFARPLTQRSARDLAVRLAGTRRSAGQMVPWPCRPLAYLGLPWANPWAYPGNQSNN